MIYIKTKIVIGGCRTYSDYDTFKKRVDTLLHDTVNDFEIIVLSGHCKGVDILAEKYAHENNFDVEIFAAQWSKYGKAAGPIRNKLMVQNCDYVIAFWDGKSKGTKSLIRLANEYGKKLTIEYI